MGKGEKKRDEKKKKSSNVLQGGLQDREVFVVGKEHALEKKERP